ncbi:hypothetical protein COHA_007145 [Chlorella ohadii]|uniref:Endonuclease/exonuclease/phosphatase domain-containing protein n=1 Tax=Chlorella ohadii TaxID=2649997 RepID=A0AAD5DK58_9CHLO|nr:hypothetical protein COHA_007145 [Chlorella ohadii]
MTHAFYLRFAGMPWWQAYHASPMPPVPPLGSHYFTTILWRKDSLAAAKCHLPHPFKETKMGRDLRAVSGSLGGMPLRVCTTHLESPMGGPRQVMWPERRAQMDEMLPLLDASPEPNCLVAGDMNWIPIDGEDKPVPLPPGWVDVWLELRPQDPGWTYDSQVCYQKGRKYGRGSRLDRMFCRLADWQPLAIEMVGQEPIAGLTRTVRTGKTARSDKTIPVWPSDHFGLFAVFVRKQWPGGG